MAAMSAPAEKARSPAPVITTARTVSSASNSSSAAPSASRVAGSSALSAFGRSMRRTATPPAHSIATGSGAGSAMTTAGLIARTRRACQSGDRNAAASPLPMDPHVAPTHGPCWRGPPGSGRHLRGSGYDTVMDGPAALALVAHGDDVALGWRAPRSVGYVSARRDVPPALLTLATALLFGLSFPPVGAA